MATQAQVLGSIVALAKAALDAVVPPITYQAAVGWPPVGALQDVAKAGPALVAVYDRKIGRDTSRWGTFVVSQTVVAATLTTAISRNRIAPGGTATITLGGTVGDGDAVSAMAVKVGANTGAVVAIGDHTDSPTTMAARLAALVNSDSSMAGMLTATASGPVVTITSTSPVAMQVASYAGNGGSQVREVGRRDLPVQIVLWAKTVEIRNAMSAAIAGAVADSAASFGPTLADGTPVQLSYGSDYDLEDNTLEDVYRHDFMVSVDYPVTVTDLLYAVLAPVGTMQVDS